jgi:hypothetical protein
VVDTYTAPVQALHYGVILLLFAALVVATVAGWEAFGPGRYALVAALALTPVLVSLGRGVFENTSLVPVYEGIGAILFLAVLGAGVAAWRAGPARAASR